MERSIETARDALLKLISDGSGGKTALPEGDDQ
jgi:hypothetical protein